MSAPLSIGYLQMCPALGNLPVSLEELDRHWPSTAQTQLLVLPELCNSGYNFPDKQAAWDSAETVPEGPFVQFLQEKAAQYQQYIVAGLNEREGGLLYNSAVLVGPEGHIGTYRKLHLFLNEQDYFAPGNLGLPVFDLGDFKLGILICFDWMFPEAWRILALKGADVIAHPSNLVLPYAQGVMPGYSLVNRIYTVTANRIGKEDTLTFTGRSTIASPKGEVLQQASDDQPECGWATVDITLARNKKITPRNDVFQDRRPNEYRDLLP